MHWTSLKKLGSWIVSIAKFSLEQMGYRCKTVGSIKNKVAWTLFFTSLVALVISLSTVKDIGFTSIMGNLCASVFVFIPLYMNHKEAIKIHRNNNVQLTTTKIDRTPHGSQLVIYGIICAYTLLGVIYRLASGDIALWLINYAVYFIEFINIVISVLVAFFDAEIVVD